MKIGEFFVRLGVAADNIPLEKFAKTIADIPLSAATAVASMAGLTYGFVEMTKNVLDMTSGFQVFTAETGLNTKALQQWQQVAKEAGLSGDVVTGALESLAGIMGGLRTGHVNREAMRALGQLGIGSGFLTKTPYELLNEIQGRAMLKNPMEAVSLLRSLGMNGPEMMRIFQTPQGMREKIQPAMGSGDIAAMADFQKTLADFNRVVMHEFVKSLVEIKPYMKDLAEAMVLFIKTFGEVASFWLSKLHGAHMWDKFVQTTMEGSLQPNIVGRTLVYEGGNITYNIQGLNDVERAHRDAVERQMRSDMLEKQKAAAAFGLAPH